MHFNCSCPIHRAYRGRDAPPTLQSIDMVLRSGYTHCAPLERGGWIYRGSIDISLLWSERQRTLGLTQLNGQSVVVRRFIAAAHRSQRPMNRATTIEVRKTRTYQMDGETPPLRLGTPLHKCQHALAPCVILFFLCVLPS